jgi:hypothetical protein
MPLLYMGILFLEELFNYNRFELDLIFRFLKFQELLEGHPIVSIGNIVQFEKRDFCKTKFYILKPLYLHCYIFSTY